MTDTNDNRSLPQGDDAIPPAHSYKFGTDRTNNTFKLSIQSTKFRLKTATQLKKEKSEIAENENQGSLFNQMSQAIISKTKAIRRLIPHQNDTTTTSISSNKPHKKYPKTPRSKQDETLILSGVKRPFGLIEKQTNIETCAAPTPGKKTKQINETTLKHPKAKRSLSFGNLYSDFFKNGEKASPNAVASNTPTEINVDGDGDSFETVVYKNNKRKQNSDSKIDNKKQKAVDSETPVSKTNNSTEIRAQSSRPTSPDKPTPPTKTTKTVKNSTNLPEQSKAPPKNTTREQNRSHGGPDPNLKNNGPRRRIPQGLQIVITSEGDNSLTAIGYAKGKPLEFKRLVCKALGTDVNQIVHQTPVQSEGKILMTLTGDTKHVSSSLELKPLKIKIQTNVTFTVALKHFAYIIKGVDTSSDLKELKTSIDKLNKITLLNVKFLGKPANIKNKHRAALYFETETKTQAESIVYSSCAYQGDWGRKRHATLYRYDPTRYFEKNKQKQHKEIPAEQPKQLSSNATQQNAQDHSKNAPNQNMVTPPTPTPIPTPTTQCLEGRPSKQSTYYIPTVNQSFRNTNTVRKGQNTIPTRGGPRPNLTHHTTHTARQPLLPTPVFNVPGADKPTQYGRPSNLQYQAERTSKQPLLPTPLVNPPGTNTDAFIGHLLKRLDQQHWQMIRLQRQVNMLLFHLERRDNNSYSRYSGNTMHTTR